MRPLPMPETLVKNIDQSADPEMREWFERLPALVVSLAERWSLRLGDPYQPGGQNSWVAPATDPQGRDLVLKVGWTHFESLHEPDGLRAWNGNGAAFVFDSHVDGATSALLLEQCFPGTTLSASMHGEDQDVVVADVLLRLWEAPVEGPFRPLQSMCDMWADEFEQDGPERADLDPGLVREGLHLFRTLASTADDRALLATDLHASNILASARMPWLAIDPKPYVGDPTYDVLQHLLNGDLSMPLARVRRMASLCGLDPERLALWLFARCVVGSVWMPGLRPVAVELRPR